MSFFNPFFFLLLDSLPSEFASFLVLSDESSVLAASLAGAVPSAGAFATSAFPAAGVAPAAVAPPAAVEPFVVAVFVALDVDSAAGAAPSVAGAVAGAAVSGLLVSVAAGTLSPLTAPDSDPGTTTATTDFPGVPPTVNCAPLPGCSVSLLLSLSCVIVGVPTFADESSSPAGLPDTKSKGRLYIGVFGRGAFAFAVIHANAFGSACGTGTPNAFNLYFASPTSSDFG